MRAAPTSWRTETAAALRGFAAPCGVWFAGHAALSAAAAARWSLGALDAEIRLGWALFGGLLMAFALFRGLRVLAVACDGAAAKTAAKSAAAAALLDADTLPLGPSPAKRRRQPAGPGLRALFRMAMQEERAEDALALRAKLAKKLPPEQLAKLDQRLGKWLTRRFQKGLREGRAMELLPALEAAAAAFAEHERFAYFKEILPTVRQAAELKAAALADQDGEPPHEANGHAP